METPTTKSAATAATIFKGSMSVTIIGSTFILIAESLVGFTEFFKLLLSFVVVRVFIRMKLNGELAVSFFELCS